MLRFSAVLFYTSWRPLPATRHYDVCVIGAGPAGIAAALRAVDYKKKVVIIERDRVGGRDVWNGALQSKTLWEFSRFRTRLGGPMSERLYGRSVQDCVEVDEVGMQKSLNDISETVENQTLTALKATNDVDVMYGQATFLNSEEVQVFNKAEREYCKVTADYYVIATGSKPREHPFVPADGKLVMTSDTIMSAPLPKSLVVVGAGVLGCEFASIYAALGKTKVSIIDKRSKVFPGEDEDVMQIVDQRMREAGVIVHHDARLYDLQAWEETPEEAAANHPEDPTPRNGVQYTIMDRHTEKLTTYNVDRALLAIGRTRNFDGLGLENTPLRLVDGNLHTDDVGLCSGTNNFFAVGDCNSDSYVVSLAELRGKIAMDSVYGTMRLDPKRVSECISSGAFLSRAVVGVGLNETECRRRNISYICCTYGYDLVSRAVAAAATDGFVKIIVSNDASLRILGVRGTGLSINAIVDLGALAILRNQTAYDLADRLTAYPSVAQAFQECLHAILGRSQLKPGTNKSLQVRKWYPEHYDRGCAYQEETRINGPRIRGESEGKPQVTATSEAPPEKPAEKDVPAKNPVVKDSAANAPANDKEKKPAVPPVEETNSATETGDTVQKEVDNKVDDKPQKVSEAIKEEVPPQPETKPVEEKEKVAPAPPKQPVVDAHQKLPRVSNDDSLTIGKFFHKYSPPS